MKFKVHMLAFREENEVREVDVPDAAVLRERGSLESLLGLVYYFGQSENQKQSHYSVSVGDVIELDGHGTFLVDQYGFRKMSPDALQTYRDTPRRDRSLATWGESL